MKKKRIASVGILLGVTLLFSGCARFDAAAYIQAVLDVSYKNQTESYIELTESSEEDAEAIFQNNLDATMEEFKTMQLPEKLENNYKTLFENIIKQVKYTVGEAVENEEGNYKVTVTVEPVTLFDDTYEEFQTRAQKYATDITNAVMNGEEIPSDEEMQNSVYQIYYEVLKEGVDAGIKYGKPEDLVMHVNKNGKDTYEIPAEDICNLDERLISRKKLVQKLDKK